MNTVIIDKILIHMLDMEHNEVVCSDTFIDLELSSTEYYDKKLEKCLSNTGLTELVVGSQHHLLTYANEMIIDDEQFMERSRLIAKEIFEVSKHVEEMPNSNLLFIECKVDGEKMVLIIKLNYKMIPISVVEEVEGKKVIRFSSMQCLPPKSTNVDEAIVMNLDKNTISIIEKRYMIDGKPGYYLNEQYVKGEPKLSDKQKLSLVNKAVKKVDSEFHVFEGDPVVAVKREMVEHIMDHKPIKPLELAKKVVGNDYNASEEIEIILKDCGIEEEDEIVNIPGSFDRMQRCKLVLDDDRVVELGVEEYMNKENITTTTDESGFITITLNNIKELKIK